MLAFTYSAFPHTYHSSMYGRQAPPAADMGGDFFRESIRELAQHRARKAQWLPDEVDDSDEESDLELHERRYLEALKTQENMDRMRAAAMQEEAERVRQAMVERVRKLKNRQAEAQDMRQRAVEQLIREASEKRAAALEREANFRAEHMRKQYEHNLFTAGRNHSRDRPHCGSSIPEGTPSSMPRHNANPVPEPKSQSPRKPLYTEKHETAASVIQEKFRIHRSLHTVSNVASEFQTLKSAFEYPSIIDFQEPGVEEGHISVPTSRVPSEFDHVEEVEEDEGEARMEVDGLQPKLAYTVVNYPVHLYVDAMERLLMTLDGVESWGNKGIRERRRSVVREIGGETAKLERFWKQVWADYVEKQGEPEGAHEEEEQEVLAELQEKMEIDEEPVHVEHPKLEDNRDDEWLDVAELAPSPAELPSLTEAPITSSVASTPSESSTLSDSAEAVIES